MDQVHWVLQVSQHAADARTLSPESFEPEPERRRDQGQVFRDLDSKDPDSDDPDTDYPDSNGSNSDDDPLTEIEDEFDEPPLVEDDGTPEPTRVWTCSTRTHAPPAAR